MHMEAIDKNEERTKNESKNKEIGKDGRIEKRPEIKRDSEQVVEDFTKTRNDENDSTYVVVVKKT